MILSDRALKERLIANPEEIEQAKEWWKEGDWNKIAGRMVISPFTPQNVGVCSYDLSVGEEYVSLRDPYNTKDLAEGKAIQIEPGETVLILTEEYVCLPRNIMGSIVPRARWIFEGTAIGASRVEPTWYGKLLVGFTNLAKSPVALFRGDAFCTCYWLETSNTEMVLTQDKVHFLGRTNIGRIEFGHARPQRLLEAEAVTLNDLERAVETYGTPWDIVRGALLLTKKELEDYVDR
ncbi:MAG: hypothetical protein ACE5IA_05070, partial [Dehalococcoidia bacterium]